MGSNPTPSAILILSGPETHGWLLAGDEAAQYKDAGVELLINSDYRNDVETRELFVSDVMPHFA